MTILKNGGQASLALLLKLVRRIARIIVKRLIALLLLRLLSLSTPYHVTEQKT